MQDFLFLLIILSFMKLLSHILSPIFLVVFFLFLVIFHPLQWIALNLFSRKTHQKVVNVLNWFLVKSLLVLGVRVKVENPHKLPENTTLLFVANHQSMFDISPIIWYFRKHTPKFVSKKELAKGIPSISFNLKHGGAALIDRKDRRQALTEMANFAQRIKANTWSATIFPEGTRARDGKPKKFAINGIKMLIKYNPDTYIVPLTINNSWKIFKYGKYPLGVGSPLTIKTHEPIKVDSLPFEALIDQVEHTITADIHNH